MELAGRAGTPRKGEVMQTYDDYLSDAGVRIAHARELFNKGDWHHGIFELGAASARIFQAVEWLNEKLSRSAPSNQS